jgi:choline dehydrogenase-like flavoprotein
MLINADSYDSSVTLKADICILGGGVSGIVLALELLPFFNNIALIEAGDSIYSQESQDLYAPEIKPALYPDPTYSRLRMLGGSSNHWENGTEPLDPIDFEKREWITDSGWPINYYDVEKYYTKAQEYCRVGTNGYNSNYWSEILKTDPLFIKSKNINSGIVKDGIPPTRFYEVYGEKLNDSNNITIYKNANVTDIQFDIESYNVKSIIFQSYRKIKHIISANAFIMCFGGIENARMLLEFNDKYNNSLGNQYDNVGRYFMDHPTIRAAHLYPFDVNKFKFYKKHNYHNTGIVGHLKLSKTALEKNKTLNMRMFLKPMTNLSLSHGVSSLHILSEKFRDTDIPDDFGTHITNIIKDLDTIADAFSRKRFNSTLFEDSDEFGGYQILAMMEQSPNRNNRIKLGTNKDLFDNRKITIDYTITESDKYMAWKSLGVIATEVGAESLGRVRLLKERDSRIWESQIGFGHHHIGTTRMSYSEKNGVVDANQKVFGSNNLYVSGSSVFTTGGHVPPTLTIAALTIRLADHIKYRYL